MNIKTELIVPNNYHDPYRLKIVETDYVGDIYGSIINNINQDLYDLCIIRNSKQLDSYKQTISYLVEQKKSDIKEIHEYIISKDKEVDEYKNAAKLQLTETPNDFEKKLKESADLLSSKDEEINDYKNQLIKYTKEKVAINAENINDILKDQVERVEHTLMIANRPLTYFLEIGTIKIFIEINVGNLPVKDTTINAYKKRIGEATHGLFVNANNNYNCKSSISDFTINIHNDKPIIFVCNLYENYDKISRAIEILKLIEPQKLTK
jgi:hypothetical protein